MTWKATQTRCLHNEIKRSHATLPVYNIGHVKFQILAIFFFNIFLRPLHYSILRMFYAKTIDFGLMNIRQLTLVHDFVTVKVTQTLFNFQQFF